MSILSMTGYGYGTATVRGVTVALELRSVNNRFFEVSARLPRVLAAREQDLTQLLRAAVERGRISVSANLSLENEPSVEQTLNAERIAAYARTLREVARLAGVEAPITLDQLLRFPDLLESGSPREPDADAAWEATRIALEDATRALIETRANEGAALETELRTRLRLLEEATDRAEVRAPKRVHEGHTRLRERVAALLEEGFALDPARLEQEVALLADRLDVTEEIVRLRAHFAYFHEALASPEPAGRRLNFLLQEIGREVNTLGAKGNDPEVQHLAVHMKEELEKLREQVQNIA